MKVITNLIYFFPLFYNKYYVSCICTGMIHFGWRKQRWHTGYYKESTPFYRNTIINHRRVKQVTEHILEVYIVKFTFDVVLCSIKIFSNLVEGSSSKQLFIPSHVIILIILATPDNIQYCLCSGGDILLSLFELKLSKNLFLWIMLVLWHFTCGLYRFTLQV